MENKQMDIKLTPKINNFFILYIISLIPRFFWSIFWIVILLIIIVGAVFAPSGNDDFEFINDEGSKNNVLVYEMTGGIFSGSNPSVGGNGIYIDNVKEDFDIIKENKSIKNIVFKFNSPGGEVFASEILGDMINELLEYKNIEQGIFYFDSISASGALLSSYKIENNYVFGSQYGQTGSIGVRLELPNIEKLADNIGYTQTVIKSGENKDIGSLFRQPTEDEISYFQSQVDEVYDDFINIVSKGRGIEENKVREIANGLVYFNDEAKEFGLIDELSQNHDDAIKKAGQDLSNFNTIRFQKRESLLSSLGINFNSSFYFGAQDLSNLSQNALKSGVFYAIEPRFID